MSNDDEFAKATDPFSPDTDGDGLSDGDEQLAGSDANNPDTDGDLIVDGTEVALGLDPLSSHDAFGDLDGDRYPNVFEVAHGSDATDPGSLPVPTYVVDPVAGDDDPDDQVFVDIPDALSAARADESALPIIGLVSGTHMMSRTVSVPPDGPSPLIIGLEGAGKTILQGSGYSGFKVENRTVLASLALRGFRTSGYGLLHFQKSTASGSRVNDVIAWNNSPSYSVVRVKSYARDIVVCGTSIVGNRNKSISLKTGSTIEVRSSVLYNPGYLSELFRYSTVDVQNSAVADSSVHGSNNLTGVELQLGPDGRLGLDAPVRGLGTPCGSSLDMDLQTRPPGAHDIGADQWVDVDADGLPDGWELQLSGDLTALNGRDADDDGDGATNEQEYYLRTNPLDSDSDDDGLVDGAEVTNATDPLNPDSDADKIPDGPEVSAGLDPLTDDAFEDFDRDRFPNVFEYARGSDMASAASMPAVSQFVDLNPEVSNADPNDNIHPDIDSAISAAYSSGAENYQIIGLRPGRYTTNDNTDIELRSSRHLMFIGLEGAAATILDGEHIRGDIRIWGGTTVLSSLTIDRFRSRYPINILGESASRSRITDVRILDSHLISNSPNVLRVHAGATDVVIASSTLTNNHNHSGDGNAYSIVVSRDSGARIVSSISDNPELNSEVLVSSSATVRADYSWIRGNPLVGENNVSSPTSGVDFEGRLLPGSAVIGRGLGVAARFDMDMEPKSAEAPDIGVDQWTDVDGDTLPDYWELQHAASLADFDADSDIDGDGLRRFDEWLWRTDPANQDTDGDWYRDGVEVQLGQNPLVPDELRVDADLNHDGIYDVIGLQLGISPLNDDIDGDGVSNMDEVLRGTDPLSADSDGDGVDDANDSFPLDPNASSLPADPGDFEGPTLTLALPVHAEQL